MKRRAWLARGLSVNSLYFMTGCSIPTLETDPKQREAGFWTGRLALSLASDPPESFFATFELKGTSIDGDLSLAGPLGSVLAVIRWSPGEATLRTGSQTKPFDSMETLTRHVTGTSLPIDALFDWLRGINTTGGGWKPDLSRLDQGRLLATRTEPLPAAELKLILDR